MYIIKSLRIDELDNLEVENGKTIKIKMQFFPQKNKNVLPPGDGSHQLHVPRDVCISMTMVHTKKKK